MYQNNSCGRANKGVEKTPLKRQPAARKRRRGTLICMQAKLLKKMPQKLLTETH